jgi:peroxiredoxin family protein
MTDSNGNRHMAFICSKGNLDMVYPALIMGWAALGNGIDVSIFFTFWGLDMVREDRVDHLEVPPVGNSSFKMSLMGIPGNIGIPQIMGIIPGMTPFATAIMKSKMKKLDVPPVREYLQMLMDGGAKLYGCKMTCDLYNLTKDSFIDGVQGILTASEFVDLTEGAQIIFI